MFFHPGEVFVLVGGIDDEEIIVVGVFVDDEVVDAAAVVIAHNGVARLAVNHVAEFVGEDLFEVCQSVWPFEGDLAHMADIEKPGLFTHSHVLSDDAGFVLNWHGITAEWDHFPTGSDVGIIQRCFFVHRMSSLYY